MFDDDPRWSDARERDDDVREIEVHWVELGRGPASDQPCEDDPRDRDEDIRNRDSRERDRDPRDVFLDGLALPRGREREIVMDGDHRYELNGEDSRTLATTGAFRVISERDLHGPRDTSFEPRDVPGDLRDQGLIRSVSLDGREHAWTLTERGRSVLEAHRRDRNDAPPQRNANTYLMVLLGGDAGLRLGEIVALEWCDVDLSARRLTVQRSDWCGHVTVPKGGRSRRLPMTQRLAAALKATRHLRSRRVLCLPDAAPITRDRVVKAIRAAQCIAGLTEAGVHVLRHTFCSHLAMKGAPARAIRELAGHADL